METVKIYNASDSLEANRIVEILKENDISAYTMESGSGSYLAIQQGFSIYGQDIYVSIDDKEKAQEIVDEFVEELKNQDDEGIEFDEGIDENDDKGKELNKDMEDEDYKVPWFRNRVIVARIIILGAVAFGVLWFILSNMYD